VTVRKRERADDEGRSAVNVSSVGNFNDIDDKHVLFNLVQHPIVALSDSVPFLGTELPTSRRAGIVGEGPHSCRDSLKVLSGKVGQLLGG
jgi:hypothetical protein